MLLRNPSEGPLMKAMVLFRICAVLFLFFALGHTIGFLSFRPPTADGLAVLDAMNRVHFSDGKVTYSYGGFYRGFGLAITLNNIFAGVLCWWLGGLARRTPREVGLPGWALVATQIGGLVLSLIYFGIGPAVLSVVLILCLVWAVVKSRRDSVL